jgi:hypothetical protein
MLRRLVRMAVFMIDPVLIGGYLDILHLTMPIKAIRTAPG